MTDKSTKELDGLLISLREEYREEFGFYPEDAPDDDSDEEELSEL